jgi:hypothetical protein
MATLSGHIFRFAAAAPESPRPTELGELGELPEGPKSRSTQGVSARIAD